MKDATYKTLAAPSGPGIYKDRGSKFIGMAFPVEDEQEVKQILKQIKSRYHDARHWCYAFRLGKHAPYYERANDDGEPAHSAGKPILNQIRQAELTHTLVVVVRYFGGVKLGVGGLIQAYKTAARLALEQGEPVVKQISIPVTIRFPYQNMNEVMRYIKQNGIPVLSRSGSEQAELHLEIGLNKWETFREKFRKWIVGQPEN